MHGKGHVKMQERFEDDGLWILGSKKILGQCSYSEF